MLTYSLEPHSNTPLYEQLYRAVRADIMTGALPGGTRLPSKRQLAANLRISQITVETAYGQLAAEGYIVSEARRGYFVQEQLALPAVPAQAPAQTAPPPEDAPDPCRYDFRTNIVDTSCFPFSTWARLSRNVLSEDSDRLLRASDPCGAPALRVEIARYLHDFRGINVSPDNILVGAGSEYLIHLVIQLLGRDKIYALENPGYRKLYQIFDTNGARVQPIPLDGFGLRADALTASDASAVYITPSHHFPLGTVMPAARRLEVLRWASAAPDRYVIEDDYDSEFRFSGRPLPTLQSIDPHGRVIYLNTFSQTIAPSVRVGYMVLPPRLLERYLRELDFYACPVPGLEQAILARFISGGFYERHLARMRTEYRLLRTQVLEAFRRSPFARRIRIFEQGAGLHFLLRLDTARSDEALSRRAAELGVRLGFLSEYATRPDPDFAHTLVINYGGLESEDLTRAIALLEQILE